MKVDYVYTITEKRHNIDTITEDDYKIILATTSKRQAKVVLHQLYEAVNENSNLSIGLYEVGSYLSVWEDDNELDSSNSYATYSIEEHQIVKQGYKSSLIEDKIKSLKSK